VKLRPFQVVHSHLLRSNCSTTPSLYHLISFYANLFLSILRRIHVVLHRTHRKFLVSVRNRWHTFSFLPGSRRHRVFLLPYQSVLVAPSNFLHVLFFILPPVLLSASQFRLPPRNSLSVTSPLTLALASSQALHSHPSHGTVVRVFTVSPFASHI
jgi:hypothetical protein